MFGNNWVVNFFADASAKVEKNTPLIYRYGKAVGSAKWRRLQPI